MADSPKKAFKIKVLRKEGADAPPLKPQKSSKKSSPKKASAAFHPMAFLVFAGIAGIALLWNMTNSPAPVPSKKGTQEKVESITDKKLNRYMQDGQKRSELNEMGVDVENRAVANDEMPAFLPLEEGSTVRRPMGVELEQDPAMENVYNDLYGPSTGPGMQTPEERISARLAEKRWINNYEKEEKKTFIRNFVAAAREAGYEIELNDDLVVTKVRPITSRPKMPLEKVIEKLSY